MTKPLGKSAGCPPRVSATEQTISEPIGHTALIRDFASHPPGAGATSPAILQAGDVVFVGCPNFPVVDEARRLHLVFPHPIGDFHRVMPHRRWTAAESGEHDRRRLEGWCRGSRRALFLRDRSDVSPGLDRGRFAVPVKTNDDPAFGWALKSTAAEYECGEATIWRVVGKTRAA